MGIKKIKNWTKKNWTKKNWKKLAVVGGAIVGGTALAFIIPKSKGLDPVVVKPIQLDLDYKDIAIPESLASTVSSINSYHPEEYLDIWVNEGGIPLSDLGNFGEAVKNFRPDFDSVNGVFTVAQNIVEETQG